MRGVASMILLAGLVSTMPAVPARADGYGHVQATIGKSENQIEAEKHMAAGEWAAAVPFLEARLAGYPAEVETLTDLGHAYAKIGDLEQSVEKLTVALSLDPRHLEANLYLGETYLALKDLAHAKERLAALDGICFFGCGEYSTLKAEIAAFAKANGP